MPKLLLVRGVPGVGKTTYAKAYVDEFSYKHLEGDMYFVGPDGVYRFEYDKLGEAHAWCRAECESAMQRGENIVVSNTFCTMREMIPYLQMARRHGYKVEVKALKHGYGSIHDVPPDRMQRFRERWEECSELPDLLSQWGLS